MITDLKILENFYSNPQQVCSLLTEEYPVIGCGGGARSMDLKNIDVNLYNEFCQSIFNIHGVSGNNLHVTTFFMRHHYNEESVFNHGLVHIDGKNQETCMLPTDEYKLAFCGQIFLSETPDPEAGINICSVKSSLGWTRNQLIDNCINYYTDPLDQYKSGNLSLQDYKKYHKEYHSNFDLTVDVKNVYNRMVSWKGGTLHGYRITEKMQTTLNQYFFVSII